MPSRNSETAGCTPASAVPGMRTESRRLCRSALACLGICGRICPGMWADLARSRQDGGQCSDASAVDASKLVQALSLCAALATRNSEGDGEGGDTGTEAVSGRAGIEVEAYRWRGKYEFSNGDRAELGRGENEDGDEYTAQEIKMMALIVMFEAFTGCARKGVKALGQWKDMEALLRSLMDIIFHAEEGCYLQATKVLLIANDPLFREPTEASSDPPSTASPCPESYVIPALMGHPASHEVQGAVLHILNEEGYPNGDPELARLCLRFCVDALQARAQGADLFYVNDMKVMVDVIIREVHNLPEDHLLRPQFRHVLRRLVRCSEWATRGERYREQDVERALAIVS